MDFHKKKRIQLLLFIVGIVTLSITAEKCRKLVGEEAASKSGKFTFLNCFDASTGTLACAVKEGVKLYFYNVRASHVERVRLRTIESALEDALSQGLNAKDATKQAQKEGEKAAKLATRQAKRIMGPIISSGWDFFEALYVGGTTTEGFLRGTGTLFGAYAIGFFGEQSFGRFGYLVGSHLGSWVGGRIGLMVYDVVNGVHFMLRFVQSGANDIFEILSDETVHETSTLERSEASKESSGAFGDSVYETSTSESSEVSEDSVHETSEYVNSEVSEDSSSNEPPAYETGEL